MKASSPKRNVPREAQFASGVGLGGSRSRSDLEGSKRRRKERGESEITAPQPPPMFALNQDITEGLPPTPVFGQYPRGLIHKLLPWLRCARHEIVHVCSGALPRGEGIRVDIREDAQPDIVSDGRSLPFASGSVAAVMLDPPYSVDYAASLYGVEYPRPSDLLREAARVVRPGGRIAIVHYITPRPPAATRIVKVFGLSTGANMPMRAITIYEREQSELEFGASR